MPALPTFTVTDAVAARLLKAFEGQTLPDGTALTPVQAYRRWLKAHLISKVAAYESESNRTSLDNDIGA